MRQHPVGPCAALLKKWAFQAYGGIHVDYAEAVDIVWLQLEEWSQIGPFLELDSMTAGIKWIIELANG
jgi:hypothetical protein